jgi:hypothetical protein
MTEDPRPTDMQSIGDVDAGIYEAIATLEHGGKRTSRQAITAATGLPDDVIGQSLEAMVDSGLLVTSGSDQEGAIYAPGNRGWSAAPDQARGQRLR